MSVSALSFSQPLPAPRQFPSRSEAVKQVALGALAEFVLALALTAVCFPFYGAEISKIALIGLSTASVLMNLIIRIASTALPKTDRTGKFIDETLCSANFSTLCASNALTLIHETGHAAAAKCVFRGTPTIQLMPFTGGVTNYIPKTLTSFGRRIGYRNAIFLITFSGPALALLAGSAAFLAALALRNSHSKTSNTLLGIGLFDFFYHADYAFSALKESPANTSHDFVRLRAFGIHPLAATIAIAAIPIVLTVGYFLRQRYDEKSSGEKVLM